jgi:hypothetical protein
MNFKILPVAVACGVLLGASALAQAQTRTTPSVHKIEKQGASGRAASHKAAPRGDDKTTGFGGHAGDDAFADDRGNREGHLRGDRGADMMDNVRRVDDESPE